MKILLFLVVPLVAGDLYKETQNFQYSRSDSDAGQKKGFYESQSGNMGGNYEASRNMDTLAQRQMKGLMTAVGGQLGIDPDNMGTGASVDRLGTGSLYGSASTSGKSFGQHDVNAEYDRNEGYDEGQRQYGSSYDRTTGQRLATHSAGRYGDAQARQGYSSQSGQRYGSLGQSETTGSRRVTGGSRYHTASSGGGYGTTGANLDEASIVRGASTARQDADRYSQTTGRRYQVNSQHHTAENADNYQVRNAPYGESGTHIGGDDHQVIYDIVPRERGIPVATGSRVSGTTHQSSSGYEQSQSEYAATGQNTAGTVVRPVYVRPGSTVRLMVRPHQVVPIQIPVSTSQVAAQPVYVARTDSTGSGFEESESQVRLRENEGRVYDLHNSASNLNTDHVDRPRTMGNVKGYESSYSYQKEWERQASGNTNHRTSDDSTIGVAESQVRHRENEGRARDSHITATNLNLADRVGTAGNVKGYESAYSYDREWERHGSTERSPYPVVGVATDMGAVAQNRDKLLIGGLDLGNEGHGSTVYNSGSRVASTGRRYGSAHTYQANKENAESYQTDASSLTAGQLLDSSAQGANSNAHTDQEVAGSTPKSYQSSYSYHKSWEKHGTPYVIRPAGSAIGDDYEGQASDLSHMTAEQRSRYAANQRVSGSHSSNSQFEGASHAASGGSQKEGLSVDMAAMQQRLRDQMGQSCPECASGKTKGYSASYSYSAQRSFGGDNQESTHRRKRTPYRTHEQARYTPPAYYQEQEEDLGQQTEDLGQKVYDYGQQTEDLGQKIYDHHQSTGDLYPSNYQQFEGVGQQRHKYRESTYYHNYRSTNERKREEIGHGSVQTALPEKYVLTDHGQIKPNVNHKSPEYEDLGQQTQDLGQQSENYDQEMVYTMQPQGGIHQGTYTSGSLQLGSSRRQKETSDQKIQGDLPSEGSHLIANVNAQYNERHPKENPGHQMQIITHREVHHQSTYNGGYQSGSLVHKPDNVGQDTEDKLDQQMEVLRKNIHSLGQEEKIFNQQIENLEHQSKDLGQQTEDLGQQTEDLGQQTEDFGKNIEILSQQKHDLGQQREDLGQQKEILEQHTEDLGQHTEDLGQHTEDLGKHTEDLGQHRKCLEDKKLSTPGEDEGFLNKAIKEQEYNLPTSVIQQNEFFGDKHSGHSLYEQEIYTPTGRGNNQIYNNVQVESNQHVESKTPSSTSTVSQIKPSTEKSFTIGDHVKHDDHTTVDNNEDELMKALKSIMDLVGDKRDNGPLEVRPLEKKEESSFRPRNPTTTRKDENTTRNKPMENESPDTRVENKPIKPGVDMEVDDSFRIFSSKDEQSSVNHKNHEHETNRPIEVASQTKPNSEHDPLPQSEDQSVNQWFEQKSFLDSYLPEKHEEPKHTENHNHHITILSNTHSHRDQTPKQTTAKPSTEMPKFEEFEDGGQQIQQNVWDDMGQQTMQENVQQIVQEQYYEPGQQTIQEDHHGRLNVGQVHVELQPKPHLAVNNKQDIQIEEQVTVGTHDTNVKPPEVVEQQSIDEKKDVVITTTEKPGFWKRVGGSLENAKDKAKSWFG